MQKDSSGFWVKLLVVVTFVAMITVNALANILPINGIGTGAVSDFYPNLFAPAGLTFAIWGLIYLLLAAYTLYQLGVFRRKYKKEYGGLLRKTGIVFSVSSLANTAWIFSWHYKIIPLSMALMAILIICLIAIMHIINGQELSFGEKIFIRLPFSVYFGWITVATIANATTLLVSLGWNGFGLSQSLWTMIVLAVGMVIGVIATIRFKDIAYGLVLIWAYAGILIKHTSASGFANQYMDVIITVAVCMAVFIASVLFVLISRKNKPVSS
ncbi:MAG: tryptophan-rich sensory protein [Bacillota bacterium]